jgi:serine/threonine protein kinase
MRWDSCGLATQDSREQQMSLQEISPIPLDASESDTLPEGFLVAERYSILNCLSSNRFSGRYLCQDRDHPQTKVILKILNLDSLEGDDIGEVVAFLFSNEVIALQRISDPNVQGAIDFVRDKKFTGIAMEYVSNGDLRTALQEQSLSIPTIIEILLQICSGLQAIHQARVIHRDLKPENILLGEDGSVKISNFGIAELMGKSVPDIPEYLPGTLDYLSPEYILRAELDSRLDIYSVGILGYEMITGQIPFDFDDRNKSLSLRVSIEAFSPDTFNPLCPDSLSQIILKAIRRRPEDRYQSAEEMLTDLYQLCAFSQSNTEI